MMFGKILIPTLAALMLVGATPVDVKRTVEARQAGMKQIGKSFKAISDQARGGTPDAAIVKTNADELARLAAQLPRWFPAGSGPGQGVKTKVKPEVWTKPADFKAKAAALADATTALAEAARNGSDAAALAPHLRAVGGACKACHTDYKAAD
jgi:cytochrome c556